MAAPRKEKKTVTASDEEFVYETAAGKITLPNFSKSMSVGEMRRNKDFSPIDIFFYVIERENDDDEMAELDKILDTIPGVELGNLIQDWQEHARVTLGESSAS